MGDITLQQALEFSNYRTTLNNKMAEIRARFHSELSINRDGGMFLIGPELINYLKYLQDLGKAQAVIVDTNHNPVKVSVDEFLSEITDIYLEATNRYHADLQAVRRKRTVKSILDL